MNPDLTNTLTGMRRHLHTAVVRLFMLILLLIMIIVRTVQVQLTVRSSAKPDSSFSQKLPSSPLPA